MNKIKNKGSYFTKCRFDFTLQAARILVIPGAVLEIDLSGGLTVIEERAVRLDFVFVDHGRCHRERIVLDAHVFVPRHALPVLLSRRLHEN
jgi:hypothetical protein